MDRAGSALAVVAALLGAGQRQGFAQGIEQGGTGIDFKADRFAVDGERDGHCVFDLLRFCGGDFGGGCLGVGAGDEGGGGDGDAGCSDLGEEGAAGDLAGGAWFVLIHNDLQLKGATCESLEFYIRTEKKGWGF